MDIQINKLARAVKINPSHISRIFSGKKQPSHSLARKIATELGITLDELYEMLDAK